MNPIFPSGIKPVVSQGYDFSAPANVLEQPVAGGVPLLILDYKKSSVAFNVVLILSPLALQVWLDFYFAKIASGSGKFEMELDSGNGLETHICNLVPSTVTQPTNNQLTWIVTFTILAESTPAQDEPFGGNLVDLYEIYGDDILALLNRINIFALDDLPEVFS